MNSSNALENWWSMCKFYFLVGVLSFIATTPLLLIIHLVEQIVLERVASGG